MKCGLCESTEITEYYRDEKRSWQYFLCQNCHFVFRDPKTYLTSGDEKTRYETHNNSIENEGYVRFLSPCVSAMLPHLKEGDEGLDYGSGPGPILDILFEREGYKLHNYDPYFNKDESLLEGSYDFITCTEVFEHFYSPAEEINRMHKMLRAKGLLLIMTQFYQDKEHFKNWGYRMDNTHVCFLNDQSLAWLADNWGFEVLSSDGRIAVLRK